METLANRLIRLRQEKGFATQEALAKAARIRQSFIGAFEAGNQKTSGYLPEIAHALGVDAYYLKTGIESLTSGDSMIHEVVQRMQRMSREGKAIVLDKAKDMENQYPKRSEAKAA